MTSEQQLRSMTGFGEGSASTPHYEIQVALRAVNHRFEDLVVRLRDPWKQLQDPVRRLLEKRFDRGRIEASIEIASPSASRDRPRLDSRMVDRVGALYATLPEVAWLDKRALTLAELLAVPGVLSHDSDAPAWGDAEEAALEAAVSEAAKNLERAREREGRDLAEVLERILGDLSAVGAEIERRWQAVRREIRESTRARIRALVAESLGEDSSFALDTGRLEQEIAHHSERANIQEELDRLTVHLEHFRTSMAGDRLVGKRLDFLAQEILRELNTMGAKSRDAGITHAVVEGKVFCEQLREQVQNVV